MEDNVRIALIVFIIFVIIFLIWKNIYPRLVGDDPEVVEKIDKIISEINTLQNAS